MFKLLSDRISVTLPTDVSADRYQFLHPSEVEPNLGVPTSNNSVLVSNTSGGRFWASDLNVSANNAYYLNGFTWESPSAIGEITANTANFTTITASNNAIIDGYVELNSVTHTSSRTITTETIMQTVIAEFPASVYRGGKIIIQVHKPSENITTISEFLIVHDDTTSYSTEYGIVTTGNHSALAMYETNIVGGLIRFLATPSTSDQLVFKITENLFLV